MDKVLKFSDSECNTTSLEPFNVMYLNSVDNFHSQCNFTCTTDEIQFTYINVSIIVDVMGKQAKNQRKL
jgi:hypothetical protein